MCLQELRKVGRHIQVQAPVIIRDAVLTWKWHSFRYYTTGIVKHQNMNSDHCKRFDGAFSTDVIFQICAHQTHALIAYALVHAHPHAHTHTCARTHTPQDTNPSFSIRYILEFLNSDLEDTSRHRDQHVISRESGINNPNCESWGTSAVLFLFLTPSVRESRSANSNSLTATQLMAVTDLTRCR